MLLCTLDYINYKKKKQNKTKQIFQISCIKKNIKKIKKKIKIKL